MKDLKNIWREHLSTSDNFLKSKLQETGEFNLFVATNLITGKKLFLFELSPNTNNILLKSNKFKGLAIQILEFPSHKELTIILLDNTLEDIFIAFIENIVEEIPKCSDEDEALSKVSEVISRWKKLFDRAVKGTLTPEQQKGLLGELIFIRTLIMENYGPSKIMSAWLGPQYGDKDFIFGGIGIEIKLTSSKYPSIKITNERQLESESLLKLYLFLYTVEEVREDGITLTSIINEISNYLSHSMEMREVFHEQLKFIGYISDDEEYYGQQYAIKELNKYQVNKHFPRIVSADLNQGIYNVSYRIELSSCKDQKIFSDTISELLHEY